MMGERALITILRIDQRKQVKFFDVRLPRATEDIVGVEMDFNWVDGYTEGGGSGSGGLGGLGGGGWTLPLTVNRNTVIGELKLQSLEKPNVCFIRELVMDKNVDFSDFSGEFFTPKVPTHRQKPEEETVRINSKTTLLKGIFWDRLWQGVEGSYIYNVRLCIWIKESEKQKTETK